MIVNYQAEVVLPQSETQFDGGRMQQEPGFIITAVGANRL